MAEGFLIKENTSISIEHREEETIQQIEVCAVTGTKTTNTNLTKIIVSSKGELDQTDNKFNN